MSAVVPDSLLQQIVATYAPRQVILFGSQARGDARGDSDLDLLVVVDDDAPPAALHWRRLSEARRGDDGAVDILACRASYLGSRKHIPGSFAATILREGVTVYDLQ